MRVEPIRIARVVGGFFAWQLMALIGGIVGLAILATLAIAILLMTSCEESLGSEHVSPTGEYIARVYQGYCGLLTPTVTRIELTSTTHPNAFSTVLSYHGGFSDMRVRWVSAGQLTVELERCVRIFSQLTGWQNIEIAYQDPCTNGAGLSLLQKTDPYAVTGTTRGLPLTYATVSLLDTGTSDRL